MPTATFGRRRGQFYSIVKARNQQKIERYNVPIMPLSTPRRASVSTWSLHSLLGTVNAGRPGNPEGRIMDSQAGTLDLLDVPKSLADHGFHTMELCHFHLPDTSDAYLERFKAAREEAGVELWNFLIDDGDIAHPETGSRDRDWVNDQLHIAAKLGSRCVRVIAGKQAPTQENIARSAAHLKTLTMEAYVLGVRVMTENWFELLPQPAEVYDLNGRLNDAMGLCLDFGNWGGVDKYERLQKIAPLADSCHAKCNFVNGKPDEMDYTACLEITREAGFSGPYTLVYGEPGVVWESLATQKQLLEPYLA
jgi:sugar phosphate isomerase/epimerase